MAEIWGKSYRMKINGFFRNGGLLGWLKSTAWQTPHFSIGVAIEF